MSMEQRIPVKPAPRKGLGVTEAKEQLARLVEAQEETHMARLAEDMEK